MRLFSCPTASSAPTARSEFATPIGVLRIDLACGSASLQKASMSEALLLPDGSTVGLWQLPGIHAELWCGSVPQAPRRDLSPIDGCLGAILRFEALEATPGAEVSCAWDPGASWTECNGPESGEWLDSQSWHDGRIKVALGTEGGDALAGRAELRLGLPERLAYPRGKGLAQEVIPPERFLDLLTYEDSRLVLRLPSLRRDEQYQFQFVCAWAAYHPEETTTSLTVERTADSILQGRCAPAIVGSSPEGTG